MAELNLRRSNLVGKAQQDNTQRRQEIDQLHSDIQNTELDLECGRLLLDEYERLDQVNKELFTLALVRSAQRTSFGVPSLNA